MRDEHIIKLIEGRSIEGLTAAERQMIEAHADECTACRRAFDVAGIAARLLHERAAVAVEPPSFFQTKVLAAIREKGQESFGLRKMWLAARAMLASMAMLVVLLTGFSYYTGDIESRPNDTSQLISDLNLDPDELLLSGQENLADGDVSDSQVLTDLYQPVTGSERNDGK
jgi:predicted anti-sigma-YlaC factor YlaD